MISPKWAFLTLAFGIGLIPIPGVTGVMVFAVTWAVIDFKHAVAIFLLTSLPWLYGSLLFFWQTTSVMLGQMQHVQDVATRVVAESRQACGKSESCVIQELNDNAEYQQVASQFNGQIDQMLAQERYSTLVMIGLIAYTVRTVIVKKNEIRRRIQPLHAYAMIKRRRSERS